ncbi:THO complex subunit 2 isoform X3 [Lutzomyia longipalpis]|uniref:THO complex subunit 2 isoform X3 n=1 Tax=Lutzomyia longipalpis TaxID=7200 RepID=UPI00248346E2|nr:THO complex subunit 2 isoform X3 [Lutzomyia longipalpis]
MASSDIFKQTNWERSGKSEFLRQCKKALKDSQSPLFTKSDRKASISHAVYELLAHGVRGHLRKDSVLSALSDLAYLHSDMPSIILDVIGVLDAETSANAGDSAMEERQVFCHIVKGTEKFLSEKLLKERLEIDTLQEVGTVKNRNFYTKFIKVKTKLYYKQRRFNLFREESEGYAKLITELNKEISETVTVQSMLEIIKSLIGCFNSDPNRVLDIILESFETRPDQDKLFIPLLQAYMPDGQIICEVLGYKYSHYADIGTPESLYKVTAILLQNSVISLDEIYSWLSPSDKTIIADWETEMTNAKEFVRKLNIVSTNKDKEPENEPEKDVPQDKFTNNQKFGLCEALLGVGDWITAQQLIKKLPDQCTIVHEPIARALCKLIHSIIEPVYAAKCSKAYIKRKQVPPNPNRLAPPQVTSFHKLRVHAFPMFIALGPSLYYDPVLLYKLIRLMKAILQDAGVDAAQPPPAGSDAELLYHDILSLMDAAVLPALSYLDCNCCVAEEIWTVLKFFPYQYRFSLYARWKNETYLTQPKMIQKRGAAQKQIKALMKRVSKENVKPVGRLIGKLSHCSPGFLFDYILLQIQIYDNLIGPVVDSLKYLTSLSYDVLGYCLVEALAQADRDRFKHDGTSLSMWLQSLASFCGAIYKKYNIELSGLLQYVANQLKAHKSLDLLILKEVVQKMAGIEAAEEMTNDQLSAMCGGEQLRGEAGYFSQVRNTKKSSQRLKDALASNDLSVALCLLMAQQKHCVIYRETAHSHLKLVGKLYDQCQDTLVQFGTFLGSTYTVEEYMERLPSIHSMLQEYHIHSDVAFFLARPMFSHQINQKYDQLRKADPNTKKLTTTQKLSKYLEATASVMVPIVESVRPLHPPKVWEDVSPQFLVTFWSLSMYDLQVPAESYQKEIAKLKLLASQVMESKEMNASKGKKEQERYLALIDKLQDERKKQQEHVDKTLHRLSQEKDSWFLSRSVKSAKNETITQFLQLCLFPRCTFTALDAIFCAKFVHTIHSLKTANFSTLLCYDRIFCDITNSVTSCTENEATRYGRFLCAMLETVMRWHADQAVFNKECANFPGFVTKFRVSNQFSEANDHVGYENYRHVCHKWHYKITKAMVFCLDSKDYMQIRNSLIILMKILPHFPVLTKLSQIIEKKVEKVKDEEKNQRQDLYILAASYIGQLKAKASQMIRESDFHQVADKPAKEASTTEKVVNGDSKAEKKEAKERTEKSSSKSSGTLKSSTNASTPAPVVEKVEKEATPTATAAAAASAAATPKKESTREGSNRTTQAKEKTPKEIRREERQREKREEGKSRKRDKEKRRERKAASPSSYYDAPVERYYPVEHYDHERERDRDRDLSSVSNSSNGSTHRRSQEPPEQESRGRRAAEFSGASPDDEYFHVTDSKRRKMDVSSRVSIVEHSKRSWR